ncbi:MAG: Mce-associated rane protein [Mycobacterium sp.]|nr:Mce-associated rane protein [Mycobacterium sp.]
MTDKNDDDVTDAEVLDAESGAEDLEPTSNVADPIDGDADESGDEASAQPDTAPRRARLKGLLVPLALVVALLASAGLATWLYVNQFRPDRESNATVAAETVKAASDGAVALLSYAPDTMDKDFATAKTHLTGDFLNYYSQFTQDIVTPAVKQKSVKTSATIVQAAASEVKPDSAMVLLFLNQTTTSKENPDGSFTASSVKVKLTKVNDAWLISAFDPV